MARRSDPTQSTAAAFESLRSDYQAAKSSRYRRRRTGISSSGSGADYHYRSEGDFLRILEYARDMDRNDCIVGQTVDRAVQSTIRDGMTLDVSTGDENLDDELDLRWKSWTENPDECDLAGEMTFCDMEQLVFRASLVDGDVLALPNIDGPLQLIEAHRLRTPTGTKRNVVHGVMLDAETRKRQEYWFTREDVNPMAAVSRVSDIERVPARDADGHKQVFHVYDPKRISQTRAVSALAPIFDCLGMFEDINFAKLVQQQIVSCFAIFRMQKLSVDGGATGQQHGERTTQTLADGSARVIEGIAPGMELRGEPGEELQGFSPNVPNDGFFEQVDLILNIVAVNLGLPLGVVLLKPTGNFSAWRGAIDQARAGFRRNQKWLVSKFHKPVYRWKVRQWLSEDAAMRAAARRPGINVFGHQWNTPSWPYIQPVEDAEADTLRVKGLLASLVEVHAERGSDAYRVVDNACKFSEYAIGKAADIAAKLKKEKGIDVTWERVLFLIEQDLAGGQQQQGGRGGKPGQRNALQEEKDAA